MLAPIIVRSETWVCGCLIEGIAVSDPDQRMYVFLLLVGDILLCLKYNKKIKLYTHCLIQQYVYYINGY